MRTWRRRIVVLLAVAAALGLAPMPARAATEGTAATWRQVSASPYQAPTAAGHTCGVTTANRLYCWGSDKYGELGDDEALVDHGTPVEVAGHTTDWSSVTTGHNHTCARKVTGRIFCWGRDLTGAVGDGAPYEDQPVPVEIAGHTADWTSVSAGRFHNCARKSSGRLYCWGADGNGRLGNDTIQKDKAQPVQVAGGATDWVQVSAGSFHTCARKTSGRLFCWGADGYGRLGDGAPNHDQPVPVEVLGQARDWVQVSAGGYHTCARKSSGRIYCWGRDSAGALGNNESLVDKPFPRQVAGLTTDWTAISAGGFHTCARKASGRLFCWGSDYSGELGDGAPPTNHGTPVEVAGGATDWLPASAGGQHTCARKASGALYCWGNDYLGQLGDDETRAPTVAPVPVAPVS